MQPLIAHAQFVNVPGLLAALQDARNLAATGFISGGLPYETSRAISDAVNAAISAYLVMDVTP